MGNFAENLNLGNRFRPPCNILSEEVGRAEFNRDLAFFVFERTKHQPRRHLHSYLVLQRLCSKAALSPGIDAFWY